MIELGKAYKTRDGREVKLLMVDGGGDFPVLGAIFDADAKEWDSESWKPDGACFNDGLTSVSDLIEVKPERTGWVNVYPAEATDVGDAYMGMMYPSKEKADKRALINRRIACLKITFTDGQGL